MKYKIIIINDISFINNIQLNNDDFVFISGGCWFDKNSICKLVCDCGQMGLLMSGKRGNHLNDEELCLHEEFDIYNKKGELLISHETN